VTAPPAPAIASAPTAPARPGSSPSATAAGSTTSAPAGPTPEPAYSSWSRTCTSASSTPPPASSSANSPSTPASATRPPRSHPAGQRNTAPLRRFAVSSMSCDITHGGRCWVRTNEGLADGFTALSSYSSLMPPTCRYAFRGGIWGRRRPLCVRALGAGGEVTHGRARTAASGGCAFTPRSGPFWPLTCGVQAAILLSPSSSSPGSGSVSLLPRASVMRWFAASACPSMQCA
jgi:hypothetical protein